MPTQQALPGLAWRPYGSLDGPTEPLVAHDEATVDEEHTASVPGALLRLDETSTQQHTWTPEEEHTRTFHGYTQDPTRPVELVVDVQQAAEDSGSSSSSGSPSSTDTDDGEDTEPPTASLTAPDQAERNVTFTVDVHAAAGEHPVTAFRLQAGQAEPTDWRPAGTFEIRLDALGDVPIQAWARDAEGHVSQPAQTNLTLLDASPRLAIDGPTSVNRTEPATFTADARDPDGTIATLSWEAPSNGTARGPNATFTFTQPGAHAIQLRAEDEHGNTAEANATVHAVNRAPRNVTVHPGQLTANETQVIEAEAGDPDGDPLEIAWHDPGADEPRAWGRQLHLDPGPPGRLGLVVNVSDPHGAWTSARVELPVEEDADEDETAARLANVTTRTQAPQAEAPTSANREPARVDLPDEIRADAATQRLLRVDAASPEGPVANVTVALGGPLPVQGTDPARVLLPALPAGEYELAARAADPAGWGPWTNATLVVEPTEADVDAEPTARAGENATPVGLAATVAALALAAGRTRP
jgi:hypothetical protein